MTLQSLALGILALGLIAAGTYGALGLLGDSPEEGVAHNEAVPGGATGDILSWSTRQTLALCVEPGGQAAANVSLNQTKIEPLAAALRQVASDPYFDRSSSLRSAADNSEVDIGCPSDVLLACPRSSQPPVLCAAIGKSIEAPNDPGPYRLHVFVLSESDLDKALALETIRHGPGDFMCHLDSCSEVTGRLYITVDELGDTQKLATFLRDAFALDHRETSTAR